MFDIKTMSIIVVYIAGVIIAIPVVIKERISESKEKNGRFWKENWNLGDTCGILWLSLCSWVTLLLLAVCTCIIKLIKYLREKRFERDFLKPPKEKHRFLTFLDNFTMRKK